jgi:hypothetical protein
MKRISAGQPKTFDMAFYLVTTAVLSNERLVVLLSAASTGIPQ